MAEAARASEERYRRIFETTSEGIWMADLSGVTTLVNPQMAQMLGSTPGEMVGRTVFDYVSRKDRPVVRRHFREFLREPTGKRVEERLRRKDGTELWALVSASVVHDGMAQPAGFLGMFADITDRRRAEQALRKAHDELETGVRERTAELQASNRALADSEEKYRRLFETISDAVLVFEGASRKIVEVNETALRLYGYTRAEFLNLRYGAITAEREDSEAMIRLTIAGMAPRIPLRYHRKKDGTVFPVEISGSTFLLQGRPMVCGIVRDITTRQQAEGALRSREKELADFFAEAPLGLLWVEPGGRIVRVNQAELDLLGRSGEEVFGHQVSELHADGNAAEELLRRLAKGETVQNYRARLLHKDGSHKEVLIDANGLRNAGRLVHSRWFTRDITRRVELETEILAISEREQRRLGQDLHDDLCQQLAGIEFLSQGLASHLAARSPKGHSQAREIARMVQHAMTQTRELARGLSPVRFEAEGLAEALRGLAASTRRIFGCDCRFRCHPSVRVREHTAAIHLFRIAQEAVSNAVKHGRARRIEMTLAAADGAVALRVRDDGCGIPRKLPNSKGMGLRIMRYRAEVIGGSLSVQRGPRGGTWVACTIAEGSRRCDTRIGK